jgi:hypothetical protein
MQKDNLRYDVSEAEVSDGPHQYHFSEQVGIDWPDQNHTETLIEELRAMSDAKISEILGQLAVKPAAIFHLSERGGAPTGRQMEMSLAPNVFKTLSEYFGLKTSGQAPDVARSISDSSFLLDNFMEYSSADLRIIDANLQDLYQKAFGRDFGLAGYPMLDLPAISTNQLRQIIESLCDDRPHNPDILQSPYDVQDIFKGAQAYLMLHNQQGSTNQFDGQFMNGRVEAGQTLGLAQVELARYAARLYGSLHGQSSLKIQTANERQCLAYEIMRFGERDSRNEQRLVRVPNYTTAGKVHSYRAYKLSDHDAWLHGFHQYTEDGTSRAGVKLVVGPIPIDR